MSDTGLPEFPAVPKIRARILIAGELRTSGFDTKPVTSNCTADGHPLLLGESAHVSSAIFEEAVDSAFAAWAKGLGAWPTARMEERITAVVKFRDQMVAKRELICRLLMWEIGKSWTDSQVEFDRTVAYIDDTVEEVKQLDRDCSRFTFAGGVMAQIRRAPLGVTLSMGPFNYPLNETFTTLIPALIMGNTVVVKTGKLDVLAFIGSSRVASQIKTLHPQPHRFRSILSLDAKNPAIVFADADLNIAVSETIKGALSFNGQRCTALKLIFVHRSLEAEFAKRLTEAAAKLPAGMPWETGVQITPLPDSKKPDYLNELIEDAVKKGAKVLSAVKTHANGSLFHPVVLSGVTLDARLAKEEQFGPVIPICAFDSIQEVEDYIVNSHFGAQVSLFGRDPEVIGQIIDRLSNQVCRINLNTQCQRGPDVFPFTGRKDSAEGTLSVYDALRAFSIRSMVAAKHDSSGKEIIKGILQGDTSRFLTNDIVL